MEPVDRVSVEIVDITGGVVDEVDEDGKSSVVDELVFADEVGD